MSSMKSTLGYSGYNNSIGDSGHFPSPFLDMASTAMPDTMSSALEWCEYIYQANSTLRQACERIIAYFLTDVVVGSRPDDKKPVGDDDRAKWETVLTDNLKILETEQSLNRDFICYGNGFASFVIPFKRFLSCKGKRCGSQWTLRTVHDNPVFRFNFTNWEFHATCPTCGYHGPFRVKDQPETRPDKLKIKRWNPHDLHILHDPLTDECQYFWRIPEDYKSLIKQAKLFHLEQVSKEVLKAIKHNQLFRFAPNVMYHMKEPALAGVRNRGWGISRLITSFRQAWYVQVLHRYNEAIALDYVIPFRLITPAISPVGAGASGPLDSFPMGTEMAEVRRMLKERRRDPSTWHTLGFPVEYKALGGDATKLAPSELLSQGLETLLNGIGTPVELYKGTMQLQTAPVSLRLFEATWYHMVHANNSFLSWVVERISEVLNWESIVVRHRRVTHADDMQRHMAILQMAMGGGVSMTSALDNLGLRYKDEQRNISEEARFQQEQQSDIQEEMEQSAFGQQMAQGGMAPAMGGAPAPPGLPGGGAGGVDPATAGMAGQPAAGVDPATGQSMMAGPVTQMVNSGGLATTPDEMMAQAEAIAQELLGLPEGQKDSELRALKQKNPALHAVVREKLDDIRSQADSQGGDMLMQQEFAGGQPAVV